MMNTKATKIWIAISVVVVVSNVFLVWFYRTQTVWVESLPYTRSSNEPAKTLVVVYSRTGNTLGAAKEIARYFDGDLIRIDAPQYSRDINGQMLASRHADEEVTTTPITHDTVILENYDLIFLCSPTWWFRPAVPMWSFVENHDFAGKQVFLMMTGNSRITEERTGKFKKLVQQKRGEFLDLLFIRRGRIYWQKTPKQVNEEVKEALNERKEMWENLKAI